MSFFQKDTLTQTFCETSRRLWFQTERNTQQTADYPKTRKLIEKEGFSVKELNVSEFRKGDGALTCLSIIW